jgi:hypothetical protein
VPRVAVVLPGPGEAAANLASIPRGPVDEVVVATPGGRVAADVVVLLGGRERVHPQLIARLLDAAAGREGVLAVRGRLPLVRRLRACHGAFAVALLARAPRRPRARALWLALRPGVGEVRDPGGP